MRIRPPVITSGEAEGCEGAGAGRAGGAREGRAGTSAVRAAKVEPIV
jgi:hypothetical protein